MKWFFLLLSVLPVSAESLHYSVNWASGLSLGDATLTSNFFRDPAAQKSGGRWDFQMDIDASVPGFAIRDHYQSSATAVLCSVDLEKRYQHGSRKAGEKVTFDPQTLVATRTPLNGGDKTEVAIKECAREPMALLEFFRKELAQGKLAPQQEVIFGATYNVRFSYTGAGPVKVGEKEIDADHIVAELKGPATDATIDIYLERDPVRTPVLIKIPSALGTFSVELTR